VVAVVSGNGLGLLGSSAAVLGGAGSVGSGVLGRGNDRVVVNAATGNLVIQSRDDLLVGQGPDAQGLRTYNSQGLMVDDNGDNWQVGLARRVYQLTGVANSAGSTVTRRDEDGLETVFTWNAAKSAYLSTDGAGAYDSLSYNSASQVWTFTDGTSRVVETYAGANAGRLVSMADTDGNSLSLAYNAAGLVSSVTDASGEVAWYDYNASNQLTQIRTTIKSSAAAGAPDQTLTRVRYTYDSNNRLWQVIVDLSPEDNATTDGRTYTTTYTYEGTSKRLSSISQSDGSQISFTYQLINGAYRVQSATDTVGTTSFAYDTVNRTTAVTDALGLVTTLRYDGASRLTEIDAPAVSGVIAATRLSYTANGDVATVTDAEGRIQTNQFDASGNLLRTTDAAGNSVSRTYDANNQLLTETVAYAGTATGSEAAARYVYDAAGKSHLRFAISAEGRVSEYRYNAFGQQVASLQYTGAAYNVAGLTSSTVPSESTLAAWCAAQDLTRVQRQDMAYDWRGNLCKCTTYASVDAAGNGVTDGSQASTQFIYDTQGLLLQTRAQHARRTGPVHPHRLRRRQQPRAGHASQRVGHHQQLRQGRPIDLGGARHSAHAERRVCGAQWRHGDRQQCHQDQWHR
jgi:YD repeat-containing protein